MHRVLAAALLLLTTALAGCSGAPDGTAAVTDEGFEVPAVELPQLHGWVFDAAFRPLPGVQVSVLETEAVATTDGGGAYAFDGLPVEEPIVLVASLAGFEPASKAVTLPDGLPVRLNFTLERLPEKEATMEVLKFSGFLSCQASVVVSEQEHPTDCSGGAGQDDVWEFAVGPDLAGAVIEIAWTPGTPAADSFSARLETLGLGDLNTVLAETVGESVLRLTVPQATAEKYYPAGGIMRLTVRASPNVDEEEAGTGAAVAFQQDFEAFASLFYVEGPPTDYTIQDA